MKKFILLLMAAFLIFSSCSLVEDMSDTAQVKIQLGNIDSGLSRFIADDGDNIIIAFLSESDVYLYEEYDVRNEISMNGIITGDYILLVLLREANDDNVVGLASQDVTIEAGVNEIDVTLGPGIWGLKFGPYSEADLTEIDLSDLPSGYDMLVGADNIVFDIPDDQYDYDGSFYFEFKTNAISLDVSATDDLGYEFSGLEGEWASVTSYGARSFLLKMTAPDGKNYEYTISFEEPDDLMIIDDILQ